jgi:hypothetical protein
MAVAGAVLLISPAFVSFLVASVSRNHLMCSFEGIIEAFFAVLSPAAFLRKKTFYGKFPLFFATNF